MFVNLPTTPKDRFAIRVQNYNYLFEWENVSVPYFLKYTLFLAHGEADIQGGSEDKCFAWNYSALISKYKGENLNYVRLILKRFLTLFVQVPFPEFSKINMHVESYTIYNIVCFSESCIFVDR